ncbi:MAG: division/cell wall cluster transcriptional repressor MraZ [Solirubrobacteraceae bacterium]
MPFHGIHDHTLDAKNRLTVPARARAQLAGGVALMMGFERCLQIWPAEDHAQVVAQSLAGLNPLGPQARALKRHLYGNTLATELDSAGRIMLPPAFADHAGIGKEVKVIGAGECLELWDRDTWATDNADLIDRAAEHIASVGHAA